MEVTYVFACLTVADRDRAVAWYERLLGRPPTFLPNEDEAVWQLAATASLYLLVDAARAGHSIVTLVVDDLNATVRAIGERGIAPGPIDEITGAGRKSTIRDPDGNAVSIVEIT
ncbi:MAG TPA: VOC family protein [Chloroflexota bacterium]|nr:VOC family protein [Chloroflexota bacterium]